MTGITPWQSAAYEAYDEAIDTVVVAERARQ